MSQATDAHYGSQPLNGASGSQANLQPSYLQLEESLNPHAVDDAWYQVYRPQRDQNVWSALDTWNDQGLKPVSPDHKSGVLTITLTHLLKKVIQKGYITVKSCFKR
jgi:hypothetical protein